MLVAKRNSFSIHRIEEVNNLAETNQINFYTSKDCSFIPITITLNLETNQLSAEHTHPPTEYFYGLDKLDGVRLLKKTWV